MAPGERRAFQRVPSDLEVELLLEDGSRITAAATDLSLRGIAIRTGAVVAPGVRCRVSLRRSGAELLAAHASIAHATSDGLGLRFDQVSAADFERLDGLVLAGAQDPRRIEDELERHLGTPPAD